MVTQKLHNAGHNCVASQVLVLPADWDGSSRMLDEIRRRLDTSELRVAYYPGTEERLSALQHAEPAAQDLGGNAKRLLVTDVQSGIGVVHNALMFDQPLKTVVSAPFRPFPRSIRDGENTMFPKPPWFLTNKTSESTARKLTEFAAAPSAAKLPALFTSALRG